MIKGCWTEVNASAIHFHSIKCNLQRCSTDNHIFITTVVMKHQLKINWCRANVISCTQFILWMVKAKRKQYHEGEKTFLNSNAYSTDFIWKKFSLENAHQSSIVYYTIYRRQFTRNSRFTARNTELDSRKNWEKLNAK